jgi:hypothetical protein
MNKLVKTVLAAGALIVGVQQSQAIPFRDAQTGPGDADPITPGDSAAGVFNIVVAGAGTVIAPGYFGAGDVIADIGGFSPVGLGGTDTAISGTASFFIRDITTDEATELVDIKLGAELFLDNSPIPNGGTVIASGPLGATFLIDINADGTITWTVENVGESTVVLDHAILTVEARREPTTTTPDGGATAMLLGLGTLGVAALRRKLS